MSSLEFEGNVNGITIKVFSEITPTPASSHTNLYCEIDDESVLVGGGAVGDGDPGALLTASYPRADHRAWAASSTDHVFADPHQLTCYAIGMRLPGRSRQKFQSDVQYGDDPAKGEPITGAPDHHPVASAQVDDGFTLIGGGFQVNEIGTWNSLATASYPEFSQEWTCRSKDHGNYPSKTTITTYPISIRKELSQDLSANIIPVEVKAGTLVKRGDRTASALVPDTYALTGIGAEVHWSNNSRGQLLWELRPSKDPRSTDAHPLFGVTASCKSHGDPADATLKAWAIGIRLLHERPPDKFP
ncbi:hypothetical protein ACFZA1_41515 [Streptomyces filipinensis]|uniref:hypothetical protein n=1 Tax=Streptomyces filipinensis TaxID=66887 RepID=UPI0036E0EF85